MFTESLDMEDLEVHPWIFFRERVSVPAAELDGNCLQVSSPSGFASPQGCALPLTAHIQFLKAEAK